MPSFQEQQKKTQDLPQHLSAWKIRDGNKARQALTFWGKQTYVPGSHEDDSEIDIPSRFPVERPACSSLLCI